VRPKTVVIDVGANVGFFTLRFASWVTGGGKVIALEPEAVNCARLRRAVSRAGSGAVVETVQAAAADVTGEGLLQINPGHPGDHKLGAAGVPVALTTLDDLLAARGWPEVSLIKIDVQGAEARVLAGARGVIERFRPALFVEVDDRLLRRFGSSARELLAWCASRGYAIRTLDGNPGSDPLTVSEALGVVGRKGYTDLLLLPADPAVRAAAPPAQAVLPRAGVEV
jgi:FkbM family methyltransferase